VRINDDLGGKCGERKEWGIIEPEEEVVTISNTTSNSTNNSTQANETINTTSRILEKLSSKNVYIYI